MTGLITLDAATHAASFKVFDRSFYPYTRGNMWSERSLHSEKKHFLIRKKDAAAEVTGMATFSFSSFDEWYVGGSGGGGGGEAGST